jgi:hypothetical protein
MMPAISLTANLPGLPPFQFLPEADLNFDAVLEGLPKTAPASEPIPPAPVERVEPVESVETIVSFLGINPVKGQATPPETAVLEEEVQKEDRQEVNEPPLQYPPVTFSREGGNPQPKQKDFLSEPSFPPARENGLAVSDLTPAGANALPAALRFTPPAEEKGSTSTATRREPVRTAFEPAPSLQTPLGLSQSRPSFSSNLEEKDSTSTGSVRTGSGAVSLSITQPGLNEVKEPTPAQPTASAPDPLRFVVERQLDLARDSRWLDALARDIVAVADRPDQLSFRLSPPRLGRLDVDMSSSESGLSLRLNTSTEAAAQIITAAQPRLIEELKGQGVRVAEAQVSTSSGGSQNQQGQQQQRGTDQMIEFVRERIARAENTNPTRPNGRFA